jgi:hypothetical protein
MGRRVVAMDIAERYGAVEGDQHKAWVIDQLLRNLLPARDYREMVARLPTWNTGIKPE